MKRYWLIEGYDGLTKIYERKVEGSHLTENQVPPMLMTLAAKAGLTLDEIVGAYARRRSKTRNDLLRVQRDGPRLRFTCGENPYFIAIYG